MRKTLAIVAIALMIGMAVPAAMAHTEERTDACNDQHGNSCTPQGNHNACTGVRDWHASGQGDNTRSISIENSIQTIEAYVNSDWDTEGFGDDLPFITPGIIYIESNGFSGLQHSDWECKSPHHEDAEEWMPHPDQVIL